MALENRHVYQFFPEYEMQTPIEDYKCNHWLVFKHWHIVFFCHTPDAGEKGMQ